MRCTATDLLGLATKTWNSWSDKKKGQSVNRPLSANLEHVEALVLHHLAIVSEQRHTRLQVLATVDVRGHHIVVTPIQKDFAE